MNINSDLPKSKVKIWGVIEGPRNIKDFEPNLDSDIFMNLCKVEIDGKIENIEYYFDSFNDAYDMYKHFLSNIEPLEVEREND